MTGPAFYTSLPVTIQAMQFREADWQDLNRWLAAELPPLEDGTDQFMFLVSGDRLTLHIRTREGDRDCEPGYWILKGTEGEFYCVADSVFRTKYRQAAAEVAS